MTNDHVVCDLLMKDGIEGRQDEDAIARACLLTQLAVELGRKRTVLHAPSPVTMNVSDFQIRTTRPASYLSSTEP
jgi:hypothetical protein